MNSRPDDPSLYFGDYPDGAYFSAVRPDGYVEPEEDFSVEGTNLQVMWDQDGPLWSDDGLLPDDPEWMRRALGLSDSLIADLLKWVRDMDEFDYRSESRAPLDERARQLAERVQAEVGTRFQVGF